MYRLKKNIFIAICLTVVVLFSCKKEDFQTGKDTILFTSVDSLYFDTVFTNTASVYQFVKVFNPYDKSVIIDNIKLMGGGNSAFKISINGINQTSVNGFELAANDSIYLFVKPFIPANLIDTPFLLQDSILISWNGNNKYIQLSAKGRNANRITQDTIFTDTVWNDKLPILITKPLVILSPATLTIKANTQVFVHANCPITVNGKIIANGTASQKIIFQSDRLDKPYNSYSGGWRGITFTNQSIGNNFSFTTFKNADSGLIVNGNIPASKQLNLEQCIIDNCSNFGLSLFNSNCSFTNCLISNCGNNVSIAGGSYIFNQCTLVAYDNNLLSHKNPVLAITNADSNSVTYDVNISLNNTIIYGQSGWLQSEISINKKQSNNLFFVDMYNCLYKADNLTNTTTNNDSIPNQDPLFVTIDISKNVFDFHLQSTSPCIGKGNNLIPTSIDIEGSQRASSIDIGCYKY